MKQPIACALLMAILVLGLPPSLTSSTDSTEAGLTAAGKFDRAGMPDGLIGTQATSSIVPSGPNFRISSGPGETGGKPGVSFDGTNFFVVWFTSGNVYGARVSPGGVVLDPSGIAISVGLNTSVNRPSVTFDGTNHFVVWVGTRSGISEVYGARVTQGGTVLDPGGTQITTGGQPLARVPGIAFDGTNFLVAWRTNSAEIRTTLVSSSGISLGDPSGIGIGRDYSHTDRYPSVAFDGTNYMIAWHRCALNGTEAGTDCNIYGARVGTDGTLLDSNGFLISDGPQNQNYALVAFDGTNYLVVWYDWRPNASQTMGTAYGARVSPGGTVLDNPAFKIADRVRGEIPVQLACDGTDCLSVWSMDYGSTGTNFRLTDVFGRRISSLGVVEDRQAIPIATAFGNQFGPAIGYGADRYLVVWNESTGRETTGTAYGQILRKETPGSSFEPSEHSPVSGDWVQESSPIDQFAADGLAFGATNSYAFGRSSIYHYDGNQWLSDSTASDGTRYGAWSSGSNDIWAGGWCRSFSHYDGLSWADRGCWSSHGNWDIVTAIWGSSLTDLWASADRGDMLRYDGVSSWSTTNMGVSFDLADLWGTASNDIHAVGERGTVLRYDGATWNIQAGVPTSQTLNAIWGSAANDIFAVGDWGTVLHYDGSTWSLQEGGTTQHLFDVWGSSGSDVYAVGLGGTVLHFDGSVWRTESSGTQQDLLAVWGVTDYASDTRTIWAAGAGSTILKKVINELPQPPTGLTVTGPVTGVADRGYPFTATITPTDVTLPITYTWQASGQSPTSGSGMMSLTNSRIFTWTTTGQKMVTATATSAYGTVTATKAISVTPVVESPSTITVTTTSDASNGNVSSIADLVASPGPDGVSLREAIMASNNTPGPKTIVFSPGLAGGSIVVGASTSQALPILTGGSLTIDGDIDGDGRPDLTIDGRLGEGGGPITNGFSLWSDNNTITRLNLTAFGVPITFAVPDSPGSTKTLSGNRVLSNTITVTRTGGTAISLGPFGWLDGSDLEKVSHLTWQNAVIAGNQITSPIGIFVYAGSSSASDNRILTTTIMANRIVGGGGIGLVAGDANSVYHGAPSPIQYSDGNLIRNATVANNVLEGVQYKGIEVSAGNMGNRGNEVRDITIANNSIRGSQIGVVVATAAGSNSSERTTSSNSMSEIEVLGNTIEDSWYGAYLYSGGSMFVLDDGPGVSDNTLDRVTLSDNVILRSRQSGIVLRGGMSDNGDGNVTNNSVRDVTISGNRVLTQTQGGGTGVTIAGGWSPSWSVNGNTIEGLTFANNQVAGFDLGVRLAGGDGLPAQNNSVQGRGIGNTYSANLTPLELGANFHGATNNALSVEWIDSLQDVSLAGTSTATVNSTYAFTASASPITYTTPITFGWQASDQAPVNQSSVMSANDEVSFTWFTAGAKTITVTATNAAGAATATRTVTVSPAIQRFEAYLPLVVRGGIPE